MLLSPALVLLWHNYYTITVHNVLREGRMNPLHMQFSFIVTLRNNISWVKVRIINDLQDVSLPIITISKKIYCPFRPVIFRARTQILRC